MSEYLEIEINVTEQWQKDLLVAQLSEIEFEGFEEQRNVLKAYIAASIWDAHRFNEIIASLHLTFSKKSIENKNWNAEWESKFHPVIVNNFCVIRASFHVPITDVQHEIIITPKMSFGTGHHATTYMMIEAMQQLSFLGKNVFDFGTGTGVLAILASRLKAASIMAIDNDDWSIENAAENFIQNDCNNISLFKSESIPNHSFNMILANINRNVILDQMEAFKQHITPEGVLLLSGLLKTDEKIILDSAKKQGFELEQKWERNDWICLKMSILY